MRVRGGREVLSRSKVFGVLVEKRETPDSWLKRVAIGAAMTKLN